MTKKALIVGFVAMLSLATFAQTASTKIKDARTKPDLYFLQDGQQASSLDLLTVLGKQGRHASVPRWLR